MPHDSPLHDVYSHGSAEDSVQQHDLTVLVTKLNDRIDGLEKDLQQTKKSYSTALTKLVLIVKKLEYKLKSGKARGNAKIEEEVHEKPSDETKVLVQEETPTEIIEEHGSGEKGEMKISTANIQVSTASTPKVSTAVPHVYTRRSAKDKGKAIMEEPDTPKKEARAFQEEEEKRLNLEAARELQRQLDQRHEVPTQPTQSQGIDCNDPSIQRYHALKNRLVSIAQARRNMITYLKNQGGYKESYFKRMSYNDIRPIFERVWDHVNTFIPIGSEVEKDSSKPSKRIENKAVGTRRKTLTRRRASDKQVEDNSKRQKKEKESDDFEQEKEDLRMWLSILKDEEESVTLEFLSVRYPIVNWEYQLYGRMEMKDMEAYNLTRAERFEDHSLEEKELILWGDLRMMFDPDEQDEIWKNQESWKVLRWRLYENSRVHSVFLTDTPIEINMLVKTKYPLKKEIPEKMINLKLQAEEESTMAFELIKFTRSQIEKQ
ncbi:hypothetical protein Tco_1298581 [Tanacetum coccineum]